MDEIELRKIIATEIARHFLKHINIELTKETEFSQTTGIDAGKSGKDVNQEIKNELIRRLPEVEKLEIPEFNLIKEWAFRNKFIYKYEDYSFHTYNRLFFYRLFDLYNPNEENKKKFSETTTNSFKALDYRQNGFSIAFFIRVENNMREILREMIYKIPGLNYDEAWKIVLEQSKDYHELVNTVFESRLEESIAESNRLLHNILPISVANELKKKDTVEPLFFKNATVLFTDFSGFTKISEHMNPKDIIKELDLCFSFFDEIIDQFKIEKIKTIGDSYMCASGIPEEKKNPSIDMALAALKMKEAFQKIKKLKQELNIPFWDIRIGFHSGPLIAGVIGKKKFSYDIWGDTVNTASRMESSSELGKINISEETFQQISKFFNCTPRGRIKAKNKDDIFMYFLDSIKSEYSSNGLDPNEKFLNEIEKI